MYVPNELVLTARYILNKRIAFLRTTCNSLIEQGVHITSESLYG